MKTKLIERNLRRKFEDWVASIDDKELVAEIYQHTIITGGCIASMLLGEKVNDYDIYFRNLETAKAVAEYYVSKFVGTTPAEVGLSQPISVQVNDGRIRIMVKSAGVASEEGSEGYAYFEQGTDEATTDYINRVFEWQERIEGQLERESDETLQPYRPVFLSTNAITLSDKVQIIIRFYGSPKSIHENFDFTHVMNYWTSWDGLHLKKDAIEKLLTKELHYVGSKYPICSLFRLRKWLGRGWTITAGQILKIALQVGDLNLEDFSVLEDQLIGVDVAYFADLLQRVKDKGMQDDRVDRAYLLQVIDEIF